MPTPKPDPAKPDQLAPDTPAEGDALSPVASDVAVGLSGDPIPAAPAVRPGDLSTDAPPAIPPDLDAALNGRERRTVWYMVEGLTYAQALDAAGTPKRAAIRDAGPPAHVLAAVQAVLRALAIRAGTSRDWIITETVALYRRATQAEEVLDRRGRPTGIYRFDGPTAAKCLSMLADYHPELRPRKGLALDAGDVATLLRAVAEGGRPALSRPEPRLIGTASAAPQQPVKT